MVEQREQCHKKMALTWHKNKTSLGSVFVAKNASVVQLLMMVVVREAECPLTTIFNLVLYSKQMN